MPRDTILSLIGTMLISEKVKTWVSNVYPNLVEVMDNHYTMGGIANDALEYIDHSIKTDNTTSHDLTVY